MAIQTTNRPANYEPVNRRPADDRSASCRPATNRPATNRAATNRPAYYRPGQLRSLLEEMMSDLKAIRKQYMSEMQTCPPGVLRSFVNRGRTQYRQITYDNGKMHRRGITRDTKLLRALARKEFLSSGIEVVNQNIEIIANVLESAVDMDISKILSDLRKRYPTIPEDYYFDRNHYAGVHPLNDDMQSRLKSHQEWASRPYEKSGYMPHRRKIRTSRGLLVRTKSEALICELLYEYGIPFRYEQVLRTESGILVPDFTFETAAGTELYWEHAGMLTDARYAFRHHLKMMQYEAEGIYPWDGLIVTYDIDNEINVQLIESVILNQLLPLL